MSDQTILFRGRTFTYEDLAGGNDAYVCRDAAGFWYLGNGDGNVPLHGGRADLALFASEEAMSEGEAALISEHIAEFCADDAKVMPWEGARAKYLQTYWGEISANPDGATIEITDVHNRELARVNVNVCYDLFKSRDEADEYLRNLTVWTRRELLAKDETLNNMDEEGN